MSLDPKTLQREALAPHAVAALQRLGARPAPALLRRASRARRRGLNRFAFSTRGPRKPAQAKKILEEAAARVAPRRPRGPRPDDDDPDGRSATRGQVRPTQVGRAPGGED